MNSTPGPACRSESGGPWHRRRFPIRRHALTCVDSRSDSAYALPVMRTYLRSRLIGQSPLITGLLALLVPLCLLAGGLTVAVAAGETCQPQAVASDFCTKFTQHGDVAAVVPDPVASLDGCDLTPHLLSPDDTFTQLLPGYLTTPSGRSPPRL